eukprot:8555908-Prorocentrum_lima.AAC.1
MHYSVPTLALSRSSDHLAMDTYGVVLIRCDVLRITHAAGHRDQWSLRNSDYRTAENAPLVEGINTQ